MQPFPCSIVIPLYNKAKSIANTIRCIQAQTYQNFEIVVVNDGSTDQSENVVALIPDNRIKLYNKSNGGVSSARNYGIQKANYEYIAFLDADDYWEPTYLEELVKLINDFPNAGLYGLGFGHIWQENKELINHDLPDLFRGIIENPWQRGCIYWTSSSTTTKTVIQSVGLFDERMSHGEDLDMWYRILLRYSGVFYNKTLAYYRQDSENRAMDKMIPLDSFLPFYIEKYSRDRKENHSFCSYFDRQCLYFLFPYILHNRRDKELKRILRQIDFSQQKLSMRLRFWCPRLYNFYLKIK